MREWSHQVHIRGSDRDRDRSMPRSSASCYHSSCAGSIRAYVRMRMHAAALQLQRACRDAQAGRHAWPYKSPCAHLHICRSGSRYNTSRALLYTLVCKPPTIYVYNNMCVCIFCKSVVQLLGLRFPSTLLYWLIGWPRSIYRHLPLTSLSLFDPSFFLSLSKLFLSGGCMAAAWGLSFPCMALVLSSHNIYKSKLHLGSLNLS